MRAGTLLVFVAFAAIGCETPPALRPPVDHPDKIPGPEDETSEPAPPPNPWSDCYAQFRTTGDASADVARLAKGCENGLHRLAPARTGSQGEHDPVQRFTFVAGGPSRCYRVYAVTSAPEVDVLLRDPSGAALVRDETRAPFAAIPAKTSLCLPQEGVYTLEISVPRGSGTYAVELWGT